MKYPTEEIVYGCVVLFILVCFVGIVISTPDEDHDDCYLCTRDCRKKRAALEAENIKLKEMLNEK